MVYLHCEEHNRQAELKQSLIKTYLENIEELKTNLCKYIDSQAKAQIDFADNGESVFMPFYFG
jgi:cell division protein FtsB